MRLFPDFGLGTRPISKQLDVRLPLLLFLKKHERGTATIRCTVHDMVDSARGWLDDSPYRDTVKFDGDTNRASQTPAQVAREVWMSLCVSSRAWIALTDWPTRRRTALGGP